MSSNLKTLEKRRKEIFDIENAMKNNTDPNYKTHIGDNKITPIKHSFSDGIYVREMFVPKGTMLVGKIIKDTHHIFLMSGKIAIITEDGDKIIEGPCSFVAKGGTKRVGYALTDVVWINVHPNVTDTKNLKKLEKQIVVENYDEYNRYLETKKPISIKSFNIKLFFTKFVNKIKSLIIKNIKI
jgi:hypothetical protein